MFLIEKILNLSPRITSAKDDLLQIFISWHVLISQFLCQTLSQGQTNSQKETMILITNYGDIKFKLYDKQLLTNNLYQTCRTKLLRQFVIPPCNTTICNTRR